MPRRFIGRSAAADSAGRRCWWESSAAVAGTAYGVLAQPGELLAALVWFSRITVLMVRTRSLWACVTAHGATNLVLGLYVLRTGQWQLM